MFEKGIVHGNGYVKPSLIEYEQKYDSKPKYKPENKVSFLAWEDFGKKKRKRRKSQEREGSMGRADHRNNSIDNHHSNQHHDTSIDRSRSRNK